jgi:hypothetical protein
VEEFETKLLLPDYEKLYERVLAMPPEQAVNGSASNGGVYAPSYVI